MSAILTPEILRQGRVVQAGQIICREEPGAARLMGPGASLRRDGQTVFAQTTGLAVLEPDRVWVYPATVHTGDLFPGKPLDVAGNLVITGAVRPRAVARASGEVGVLGPVTFAEVEAMAGCVLLSGCSQSVIRAGANPQLYETSILKLEELFATSERVLAILSQLKAQPRFSLFDLEHNLRPLLEILVERSLAGLPFKVKEAIGRCALHRWLGGPVEELGERLQMHFAGNRLLSVSRSDIDLLRAKLTEAVAQLAQKRSELQDLTVVGEAANTLLKASGDVRVVEGSCEGCQVEAGVGLLVQGDLGGGTHQADGWIRARRISGGAALQVESGGLIEGDRIQGGTTVTIGRRSARLAKTVIFGRILESGDRLVTDQGEEV